MGVQDRVKSLFTKENRTKLLIVGAVLGIALLLLADLIPQQLNNDDEQLGSSDEYVVALENKLKSLISNINGAGDAKVMITLETNGKSVYANSEKSSSNSNKDKDGSEQSSQSLEKEVTVIESGGSDEPLIISEIMPEIKGVVIVCKGAADPLIREKIVMAVRTALSVSAADVFVTY